MLNKDNHLPLYHQLKEQLRRQIEEGIFRPGDRIPTEPELQRTYGVSRITVRMAIRELANDGLLVTSQGRGTFIRRPPVTQNLNTITSWAETMQGRGLPTRTLRSRLALVKAPSDVASLLEIEVGQPVIEIERVRAVADEPISLMVNFLKPEVVPGILERGLTRESLYEILELDYGVRLGRATETVSACSATKKLAAELNISVGRPLLRIIRVTYNEQDIPFEVVLAYSRADRYQYRVNLFGRAEKGKA